MKRLMLTVALLPCLTLGSSCSTYGMKDSATSVLSLPFRMLGSLMGMFSASAGTASSD
jgi:hypothetical protein